MEKICNVHTKIHQHPPKKKAVNSIHNQISEKKIHNLKDLPYLVGSFNVFIDYPCGSGFFVHSFSFSFSIFRLVCDLSVHKWNTVGCSYIFILIVKPFFLHGMFFFFIWQYNSKKEKIIWSIESQGCYDECGNAKRVLNYYLIVLFSYFRKKSIQCQYVGAIFYSIYIKLCITWRTDYTPEFNTHTHTHNVYYI